MLIDMNYYSTEDFKWWGSKGGKQSRRQLLSSQAKEMAEQSAKVRRGLMKQTKKKAPHGTEEWATHNVNIQLGCEHNCKYCYAKCMGIRFKRTKPGTWDTPTVDRRKVEKVYKKMNGRIMFPTTHDITPMNLDDCVTVLRKLLEAGNKVLIVSKPHIECVKRLCREFQDFKEFVLFRFTIGSADDDVLAFWEPKAPPYRERLRALKWAYDQGYRTSVSSEPMLDGRIDKVVMTVKPHVTDTVWLGRVNMLSSAINMNCPGDQTAKKMAEGLRLLHTDEWIWELYDKYKADSFIRWKDSIKKVVGLPRPQRKGLDV